MKLQISHDVLTKKSMVSERTNWSSIYSPPLSDICKFTSQCTVAILLFTLLALRQISCGNGKYCMMGKMQRCERRNITDGLVAKLGKTIMELFEDTYDQVLLDCVHCS